MAKSGNVRITINPNTNCMLHKVVFLMLRSEHQNDTLFEHVQNGHVEIHAERKPFVHILTASAKTLISTPMHRREVSIAVCMYSGVVLVCVIR